MMSIVRLYYIYVAFTRIFPIPLTRSGTRPPPRDEPGYHHRLGSGAVATCTPLVSTLFEQLGINRSYFADIEIGYGSQSPAAAAAAAARSSSIGVQRAEEQQELQDHYGQAVVDEAKPSGGQGIFATHTIGAQALR